MAQKPIKARKRFGQNFLQDDMVIADIIAAIDPKGDQHLVEIGPGLGALTGPLLNHAGQLDVIELDRDLVPKLKNQFKQFPQLVVHQADALSFDFTSLTKESSKLRVIGNLPYNITTPLLFHLLLQSDCITDMCFMLQREVVERICAQPGSKTYGRLSIMIQYQCEATQLFIVPPEAFEPQPKVESAIIYLKPLTTNNTRKVAIEDLNTIVTQAFSQRRKTISNTLKNILSQTDLQSLNIDLKQRPETLSLEQYLAITRVWVSRNREKNDKKEKT